MYIEIKIIMNNSKQTDLMAMNVTWSLEDLELYDNRIGALDSPSTIFTISKTIVLAMGIIAQTTFYKMMKRLPGRVINQILYQHMVRAIYISRFRIFFRLLLSRWREVYSFSGI